MGWVVGDINYFKKDKRLLAVAKVIRWTYRPGYFPRYKQKTAKEKHIYYYLFNMYKKCNAFLELNVKEKLTYFFDLFIELYNSYIESVEHDR